MKKGLPELLLVLPAAFTVIFIAVVGCGVRMVVSVLI